MPFPALTDHPLLSEAAQLLTEPALEAHVGLALDSLQLAGYEEAIEDSPEEARANRALALQVSYQLERGFAPDLYTLEMVDSLRRDYRGGLVSEQASHLAQIILAGIGVQKSAYRTVRSLR